MREQLSYEPTRPTNMINPSPSQSSLRAIPSVDQLLKTEAASELQSLVGSARLTAVARKVVNELRLQILTNELAEVSKEELLRDAAERLRANCKLENLAGMRRVINATGVMLHTNLGRAPLSDAAREAIKTAAGYCTLEYDPTSGSRGKRAGYVEELLTQLTGSEAGLVVNNCAAAALLILTVLAREGETIVSRGELVEIGGDFRVPEVMSNSGTRMVEVGSTNRTRLEDYRQAITSETRMIMKVHPSNYRIIGFTASPSLSELADLAHESGLVLYEDAGSGALNDLSRFGLEDEPVVSKSISAGADVVSFSGDKLLGGPQAGLIVGRREIVDRLRKHSLYRALRADKLCLAALEATLVAHRRGEIEEIPVLRMMALTPDAIERRATNLMDRLAKAGALHELETRILAGQSAVGGGSGPNVHPPTSLIALKHSTLSADALEMKLRDSSPPVIARIADGLVVIDLRTVDPRDEPTLLAVLTELGNSLTIDNVNFG
jgi:L-seryl-tRNA(Ser) seleniumtransferase